MHEKQTILQKFRAARGWQISNWRSLLFPVSRRRTRVTPEFSTRAIAPVFELARGGDAHSESDGTPPSTPRPTAHGTHSPATAGRTKTTRDPLPGQKSLKEARWFSCVRRKRYVVAASAMYMCSGGAPYPLRRFDAYENMMVSVAPAHKSSRLGGVGRMPPPRLPRYPRRTKRPSRLLTARGVSQTRARAPSQLSREHAGRPPRRS